MKVGVLIRDDDAGGWSYSSSTVATQQGDSLLMADMLEDVLTGGFRNSYSPTRRRRGPKTDAAACHQHVPFLLHVRRAAHS